jgi:hypothetical protein
MVGEVGNPSRAGGEETTTWLSDVVVALTLVVGLYFA